MSRQVRKLRSLKEQIHKWEEGDVLEGTYKGFENREFDDGSTRRLYTILTEDGETVCCWGLKVLDRYLEKLKQGRFVSIKYEGVKEGQGNRTYKAFEVSVDEEEDKTEGGDIPF